MTRAVRRWQNLGPGRRRLIVVAAVAETALNAAMLVDLRRRPPAYFAAGRVRG
jgi:hypothetical protein